jgi:hypothetical protein
MNVSRHYSCLQDVVLRKGSKLGAGKKAALMTNSMSRFAVSPAMKRLTG